MAYLAGDTLWEEFTTESSTGAATNADSTPTAVLVRNGTDDGTPTMTVTNVDAGRYKVTGTIPGGYATGDKLHLYIAATMSTVATKGVISLGILGPTPSKVNSYATGQDPATLVLATPGNKLATDSSGYVTALSVAGNVNINLAQAVATSNTANTVGDALNAARAQGFGKWTLSGTTLTLYAADGTTAVRTFTLDSSTTPTSRT